MSRIVPYPLVSAALVLIWLLLTSFSLGNAVLGGAVALVAGRAMSLLQPAPIRLRRWPLLFKLFVIVGIDIIRSNLSVAWLILTRDRHGQRRSGFVLIPLKLRDTNALALLACIVTATPGTAWLEYDSETGVLTLHVFDLLDEDAWRDLLHNRYEVLLMEIFE